MPATRRRAPIPGLQDFPFEQHYGISRISDELTTPDKYFWGIKNGYLSKRNWIEQRNGFSQYSASAITGAAKVRKLFEFENKTGGRTLIGRSGTRWVRYSGTTPIDLDTGRGSDLKGQCCQFNNELIMTDGGAARVSTAAWSVGNLGGTPPAASSACHTHCNRLILNDTSDQMAVEISKVGTIDFTGSSDHLRLNLSQYIPGGDGVIGFSTYLKTFLVIWMTRHVVIYNVPETYSDISLQQILDVGCISYDGIIKTPDGDLWFPSESGYKSLKASVATQSTLDVKDVTTLIGPYYRTSISAVSDKSDIVGIFYQKLNHGYFNFPFSSAQEIWVISKDLEEATRGKGNIAGYFTGITACSFVELKNGSLIFGGNDGHIYKMDDTVTDNGSAVSFEIEKTGLYFGTVKRFKAPREFEALIEATASLTIYLDYSFGTTGLNSGVSTSNLSITTQVTLWGDGTISADPQWDVSYWDASGQALLKNRNLRGRGKIMNLRLRHSTINAQLRIPYFIISLFFQGDK